MTGGGDEAPTCFTASSCCWMDGVIDVRAVGHFGDVIQSDRTKATVSVAEIVPSIRRTKTSLV